MVKTKINLNRGKVMAKILNISSFFSGVLNIDSGYQAVTPESVRKDILTKLLLALVFLAVISMFG